MACVKLSRPSAVGRITPATGAPQSKRPCRWEAVISGMGHFRTTALQNIGRPDAIREILALMAVGRHNFNLKIDVGSYHRCQQQRHSTPVFSRGNAMKFPRRRFLQLAGAAAAAHSLPQRGVGARLSDATFAVDRRLYAGRSG